MVMQACIDDSGSSPTDPLYVLGGFIASTDQWAEFSSEWQTALSKEPALDYFKMAEANSLTGQFDQSNGWDRARRDDRVLALARIIRKHAPIRIEVSVKNRDFDRFFKTLPATQRSLATDSPYLFLAEALMVTVARAAPAFGLQEPIDFIFDGQGGFTDELHRWWPSLSAMLDPSIRQFLGSKPIDRDDKKFEPLQAADLCAWHIRKWLTGGFTVAHPVMQQLAPLQKLYRDFRSYEMEQLHREMLKRMEQFVERNLRVPLQHIGKTKRERKILRRRK
jgi:hypothetical protein